MASESFPSGAATIGIICNGCSWSRHFTSYDDMGGYDGDAAREAWEMRFCPSCGGSDILRQSSRFFGGAR